MLLCDVNVLVYAHRADAPDHARYRTLSAAAAFVEEVRAQPNAVAVQPGARHWRLFVDLCRRAGAKGNAVPDAYLAALAVETGCEWITTDRGFARYPGLRWRHPLE